jgi:hypothetical protein
MIRHAFQCRLLRTYCFWESLWRDLSQDPLFVTFGTRKVRSIRKHEHRNRLFFRAHECNLRSMWGCTVGIAAPMLGRSVATGYVQPCWRATLSACTSKINRRAGCHEDHSKRLTWFAARPSRVRCMSSESRSVLHVHVNITMGLMNNMAV